MINLGVIFGGMSTENEISQISGKSVLDNLNKEKYNIFPIYIDKNGEWYEYETREKIENVIKYLKQLDVVFPVLHGLYGEDGTIQGMLELLKIPYVGCKVLASSVGMDKAYTKIIFEKAKLNQAKYIYIKKIKDNKFIYIDNNMEDKIIEDASIKDWVKKEIGYPVFIKPSNSGSSVGVNKASNGEELIKNIKVAFEFDSKVLIEQAINGKEVECAVLGNDKVGYKASRIGQILSAEEFYTFDAKYENKDSKTVIPANISENVAEEIRRLAIKAFKAIDGSGLSRVDFFVEDETEKIYINEINTMPGFTSISMYPKLMEDLGYSYQKLLDELISEEINI